MLGLICQVVDSIETANVTREDNIGRTSRSTMAIVEEVRRVSRKIHRKTTALEVAIKRKILICRTNSLGS